MGLIFFDLGQARSSSTEVVIDLVNGWHMGLAVTDFMVISLPAISQVQSICEEQRAQVIGVSGTPTAAPLFISPCSKASPILSFKFWLRKKSTKPSSDTFCWIGLFLIMAVRATRLLLRDVLYKRVISTPVGGVRHCSSIAETPPKIPHFSRKVSTCSFFFLLVTKKAPCNLVL